MTQTKRHPWIGRTVQFPDKTGTLMTGKVTRMYFGHMDLDVNGKRIEIPYPFRDVVSCFLDNGERF